MIGNDIVDLAEAQLNSNWQRPRFLDKLFTSKEQEVICKSENPFMMVWRLWSMKEAAYKLFIQLQPSRFYSPKQFECDIEGSNGKVNYKTFECYTKTKITRQYVLSEARLSIAEIASKTEEIRSNSSKSQSVAVKALLLSVISKEFNIVKEDLNLVKSEFGIPSVYHLSKKLDLGVSITHHGCYGAYAYSNSVSTALDLTDS